MYKQLFATILFATGALAQTAAQRQLAGLLDVMNRGDRDGILSYFEKHYPTSPNKGESAVQLAENTGGFELLKTLDATETSVTALVTAKSKDQFSKLTLTAEAPEPHRITSVRLEPATRPPEYTPVRMTETAAIAAIRAETERLASQDKFAGAVMISKNGAPILAAAFGLADREKNVENRVDTRFRIGSMNKMFTAVATLQLAQAGKIDLKATVGKYIRDYPNTDIANKVTIEQLLSHTGGTGDFFGPEFDQNRLSLQKLTDYIKLFGKRGSKFEPGSQWDYSNYGFLLLGVIVQNVSGQDYYEYVREHVFKPAGMKRTDSLPESDRVSDRSLGYTRFGEGKATALHSNSETLPPRGTSAGGGYSTVEDLCRFASALTGHKLLNPQYTELLTTGKVDAGPDKYAFGFFEGRTSESVRWFGHGGGAPGMNGDLRIFSDAGYAVAVLSNLDPPAAQRVSEFAVDRLPLKSPGTGADGR